MSYIYTDYWRVHAPQQSWFECNKSWQGHTWNMKILWSGIDPMLWNPKRVKNPGIMKIWKEWNTDFPETMVLTIQPTITTRIQPQLLYVMPLQYQMTSTLQPMVSKLIYFHEKPFRICWYPYLLKCLRLQQVILITAHLSHIIINKQQSIFYINN